MSETDPFTSMTAEDLAEATKPRGAAKKAVVNLSKVRHEGEPPVAPRMEPASKPAPEPTPEPVPEPTPVPAAQANPRVEAPTPDRTLSTHTTTPYGANMNPMYAALNVSPEAVMKVRHDYLAIDELAGTRGPQTNLVGQTNNTYAVKLGSLEMYTIQLYRMAQQLGAIPPGCPNPVEAMRVILQQIYAEWSGDLLRSVTSLAGEARVRERLSAYSKVIERTG